MRVTQEELDDLKGSPTGRALWAYLHRRVAALKDQWAEGRFNSENPQVCTAANVSAVSELRMIQQIIDLDADDLNEEEAGDNREQLGLSPRRQGRSAQSV